MDSFFEDILSFEQIIPLDLSLLNPTSITINDTETSKSSTLSSMASKIKKSSKEREKIRRNKINRLLDTLKDSLDTNEKSRRLTKEEILEKTIEEVQQLRNELVRY